MPSSAGPRNHDGSKALGELAEQRVLRLGRGRITVLDLRRLAARVGTP